jgi:hypothetical protein
MFSNGMEILRKNCSLIKKMADNSAISLDPTNK